MLQLHRSRRATRLRTRRWCPEGVAGLDTLPERARAAEHRWITLP